MQNQQRNKLIVAVCFFTILTTIAAFAYVKIIKPNRLRHEQSGHKLEIKTGYKTKINPSIIDSLIQAKKKPNP